MAFLIASDLPDGTGSSLGLTVEQMIADAEALAALAAPCLVADPLTLTAGQTAGVKAILRGAIMRWNEAGTGALQSQQAGPFGQTVDTRQVRRGMFWPSEIQQLQDICGGNDDLGIFAVDTVSTSVVHADICAINFGAIYCSCGADIAYYPLYET